MKAGRITAPGAVRYGSGWLQFGGLNYEPLIPSSALFATSFLTMPVAGLEVTESGRSDFAAVWSLLSSSNVRARAPLRLAIRRFGDGRDRRSAEDWLIDLMIAAEALFLRKDEPHADLRYRVAIRSAIFLMSVGYPFRTVYDDMSEAYAIRNKLVHGGQLDGGRGASLWQFAETIEGYLRVALRSLLATAHRKPKGELMDWDELLVGAVDVPRRPRGGGEDANSSGD